MEDRMSRLERFPGVAAAVVFAAALAGFGAALDGYAHVRYPVAWLGATGLPHALAFNLLGFVLPGVLAGVAALEMRRRIPSGASWPLRIGAQLVFLSTLAFIAMGLLPLDPRDLESDASRLHGTAWMLWNVAFIPGALLLAATLRSHRPWAGFARINFAAAVGLLLAGFVLVEVMPAGVAQRIALAAWFAWFACAGVSGDR